MTWEIGISIICVGIVYMLFFVSSSLENKTPLLSSIRLFLILSGLWMLVAILNVGINIASDGGASATLLSLLYLIFKVLVVINIIVSALILILFVSSILEGMVKKDE